MKFIERKNYLNKLIAGKDKNLIKVITGIRRCGKSTLLKNLYKDWLLENGVNKNQIIIVDLSLIENENLKEYHNLNENIKSRLQKNKKNYVFIDEVQECLNFEKAILSLYEEGVADLYLTGSNSRMLSSEINTILRGRTLQIEMFPLSFAEYSLTNKDEFMKKWGNINPTELKKNEAPDVYQFINESLLGNPDKLFQKYTRYGGFPYVKTFDNNEAEINNYLEALYSTVFKKDIIDRYAIKHPSILTDIIKFVYSNIGSPISPQKITDTLNSKGRKVARLTVEKYLTYITDSMLCYKVDRNDIKGRGLLDTSPKYYATDIGLRNSLLGFRDSDQGHILENIIYFELRKRGYLITVGKIGDKEIDFIAEKDGKRNYIQVAYTVKSKDTLERELTPLKSIKNDFYPRLLLTTDFDNNKFYDGIEHKNVYDWLLEE